MGAIIEENGFYFLTDRTQADYDHWRSLRDKKYKDFTSEEKAEWATDMCGSLNVSDLKRMTADLTAIGGEFNVSFEPYQNLDTGAPAQGMQYLYETWRRIYAAATNLRNAAALTIRYPSGAYFNFYNFIENVCRLAHEKVVGFLSKNIASQTPEVYTGEGIGVL